MILEILKKLDKCISELFDEIIRLILRKSTINLNTNRRLLFNPIKGKYEHMLVKNRERNHINKFLFSLNKNSLCQNEYLLVFYILRKQAIRIENRRNIHFSDIRKILYEQKLTNNFECHVSYHEIAKKLIEIGQTIIDESDKSINPEISSKMSTAEIRKKLFELNKILFEFKSSYLDFFDSFIELIYMINSIRNKDLSKLLACNTEYFSEGFIDNYLNNDLLRLLIEEKSDNLIFSLSTIFTLLKLFKIFFINEEFYGTRYPIILYLLNETIIRDILNIHMTEKENYPTSCGKFYYN